jgi:branched-chain amino acid aminotransferase
MGKLFVKGINAVIPSQRTIPFNLLDQRIKNRNRIHFVMANLEVSKIPGDNNWALLLDPDGFITEGTGDNFFIVDRNGRVVTPRGLNILRGVSRAYIFELCRRLGFECIESDITPYDVYTAKEAFMTGTPFCMLPVNSLNSIKIGSGKVETNSTFYHLLNEWSKDVKVDIKKQIQEWDKTGTEISGPTPYSFKK